MIMLLYLAIKLSHVIFLSLLVIWNLHLAELSIIRAVIQNQANSQPVLHQKIDMNIANKIIKFLIRAYQLVLSPILGVNCRFTPSCSHYALEAVSTHGVIKGSIFICKRLLCCQPFSKKTGYDPVPPFNPKIKA